LKNLEIQGLLNENDIENLSSIECELNLKLDSVGAGQIYQLLERMGQYVKSLTIDGDAYYRARDIEYDDSSVNVERMLVACPNLENFRFPTDRQVVQDDKYNLPPSAFKNYKA
jgi:hypothetical protein